MRIEEQAIQEFDKIGLGICLTCFVPAKGRLRNVKFVGELNCVRREPF